MKITPLTRAEITDYRETSRHDEVLAFIDALSAQSPLCRRVSLGTSAEGRDIAALIVSDRKCFTPQLARKQQKVVVMVEANIHAGEVEGKEAVLALARDLCLTSLGKSILDRVCLVLVPDFNPDGNDRINVKNRRLDLANLEGQDGPEGGVGTRYTGEGWNLNRDSTKQEARETRFMARFYQAWWPHLFVDCHTTDGSVHAFDLTFDTSHGNDAAFAPLRAFAREMLERVARDVEKKHRFRTYWYGNFVVEDDPASGWHTYPALPRFGSHYRGLLGRLDVLLETYSYIPFARRCQTIRAFLLEIFRFAAKERAAILQVCDEEAQRIIARGADRDPRHKIEIGHGVARKTDDGQLEFDYPAYCFAPGEARETTTRGAARGRSRKTQAARDIAKIIAFDAESLKARRYPSARQRRDPGKRERTYHVPHLRGFVATAEVSTPAAYLVPASLAERLAGHGIAFTTLSAPRRFAVEHYAILAIEKTFSPDVAGMVAPPGEAEIPLSQKPPPRRFETVLTVRPVRAEITAPAGTLVVSTAQRAGTLAVYLLEPHSDDGFARWQYLDDQLKVGGVYPIYRCLENVTPPKKAE